MNHQQEPKPIISVEMIETRAWKRRSIIIVPINILLSLAAASSSATNASQDSGMAELLGYLSFPVIAPAIIVALFSLSPAYRNPKSRWKIFFWTSFVLLLGSLANLVN